MEACDVRQVAPGSSFGALKHKPRHALEKRDAQSIGTDARLILERPTCPPRGITPVGQFYIGVPARRPRMFPTRVVRRSFRI